jgi:hypothetical protein
LGLSRPGLANDINTDQEGRLVIARIATFEGGNAEEMSRRNMGLGSTLLRQGLERAGGLQLDVRTRTEGYYERLGASRSLGFRLTRESLGLGAAAAE